MTPAQPSPALPPVARAAGHWRLRLLGALEARNGDLVISRWPSQPTALLLAMLALEPERAHPRESLIERLWPGAPPEAGRNRLRQALSTLRRLLEGPDSSPVFVADRQSVRLLREALSCDAVEFEHALAARQFVQARLLYGGELLPGVYEDWVVEARRRLATRHEALDSLAMSAGQAAPVPPPPPAAEAGPLLPAVSGLLLGREAELQALLAALPAHGGSGARLLTLTGPGGCGKTRLAVETARRATGFDLVVFVPLADCADAAQAASQLRASLQLPPSATAPLEQAAQMLAARRALVVLDNFEQLADGAGLLQALLQRVAGLSLLVTSRRPVGLEGEREVALAPLPVPEPDAALDALARNASVSLFVHGARGVRPDFQVTARNAEALAALCRALEGLPLAIELAAARARAFSVQDMHAALAQPLELLARSGPRGRRGARHDSMRNAIEWSWRLLEPPAQALLAALSVFRGSWNAADAAAVTGGADAHALLEGLAADSLVRIDAEAARSEAGALRFGLLEVIREFAAGQLADADAAALRARHRAHFLALCLKLPPGQAPAGEQLPNLVQALRSAVADGAPATALQLALALQPHWQRRGMAPEMLALLCGAAESLADGAGTATPPHLSASCTQLALLQLEAGAPGRARELVGRALACARHAGDRAAALCAQVRVVAEGERRADGLAALLEEALALAAGQAALQAQAMELQAALAMRFDGQAPAAVALLQQAERLYHQAGQPRSAQRLRYERALCLREMGRRLAALEQAELCEVECAQADDGVHRVRAIHLQGVILADLRRWGDAIDAYRRCVREAWGHHVHYWLVFALWNHGRNLARLRQPELAARLVAFAGGYWTEHFSPLDAGDEGYVRRVRRLVRAQIGRARTQQAWVEGAAWTLPQAVSAALAGASPTT